MEAIGEKLAEARNRKNITIEQASRETNIARRFIKAMEEEQFQEFPGETYLIGFLRNYSEYLGLEGDELVGLYKSFRIQEQPVPMDELLSDQKKPIQIKAAAVVGGAVILVLIIILLLLNFERIGTLFGEGGGSEPAREPVPYEVTDEEVQRRLYLGDSLVLNLGGTDVALTVSQIGSTVNFEYSSGMLSFQLNEERIIDLNDDFAPDLGIRVLEYSASNPDAGVLLYASTGLARIVNDEAYSTEGDNLGRPASTELESRTETLQTVSSPRSFTLRVTATNPCLVQSWTDRGERVSSNLAAGQTLDLNADVRVRIGFSNPGAVTATIGEQAVYLGEPGLVSMRLVRWVRRDSQFVLENVPVY